MLKKIVAIKNVGRFKNCNAIGDVQFGKATLIYAPNGRGKTTFCDICRSLKTGLPDPIIGRATLGMGTTPIVELLLDSGIVLRGRTTYPAWRRRRSMCREFMKHSPCSVQPASRSSS